MKSFENKCQLYPSFLIFFLTYVISQVLFYLKNVGIDRVSSCLLLRSQIRGKHVLSIGTVDTDGAYLLSLKTV